MLALVPPWQADDKEKVHSVDLTLRQLLDLALPPRCPGCGTVTSLPHQFCASCWGKLRFLGPPSCAGCALPFDYDRGKDALCGSCQQQLPIHTGVHAAVAYGEIARRVALRLKYGNRLGHAMTMARLMTRLMPAGTDLLVPVPLHRTRLWTRGFNQALLMAEAIGKLNGTKVARDAIVRTRATPSLRGLGRAQRAKAVKGVFAVSPHRRADVRGRSVVLVDDVYTTGATADSCARALLRAGAADVAIICWARVLNDDADL